MLIRTSTKELILSEIVDTQDQSGYVLIHPFVITISDEETSASPFVPGTDQRNFVVMKNFITTMAVPSEFLSKFYGSILFRSLVQKLLIKDPIEGTKLDLDRYIGIKLFSEKHEILTKFGMIDDDQEPSYLSKEMH